MPALRRVQTGHVDITHSPFFEGFDRDGSRRVGFDLQATRGRHFSRFCER